MGGVTTPEKNNSRSVGKHVEGTTKTPVKAILTNYTALYFYNYFYKYEVFIGKETVISAAYIFTSYPLYLASSCYST